jgi:hypothetical protein
LKRHLRHLAAISGAILFSSAPAFAQQTDAYPNRVNGDLIVQTRQGIDIDEVILRNSGINGLRSVRLLSETMRAYQLSFDTLANDHDQARRMLALDPGLSIVQDNHRVSLRAVPNDPNFGSQWHHVNNGQSSGTPDADIDSDEAWEITTGGTTALGDEIVVCIIEGVNMSHPDLVANRWQNTGEIPGNGIDDDGNGYIDDIYGWNVASNNGNVGTGGHGTNVAGMIGAKGNNNLGVAGINWDVKIMVVSGHNPNSEANIIAAYNYPLVQRKLYNESNGSKGAFVVATNASWGLDATSAATVPLWCAFYDTLGTYGILNCGATTNSNLNVDVSGDVPTGCSSPYMIGVGRSNRNDGFAGGYGVNTIDLAAPGINVWTTDGSTGYTSTTGTSFASPLTAGSIALLYSVPCNGFAQIAKTDPQLGADMVRSALLGGVDVKPALQNSFITGGRLNVHNSLQIMLEDYCSSCVSPIELLAEDVADGEAELAWGRVESAVSYTLFYRESGADTWIQQTTNDTVFSISGLDNCARYEFYVESTCEEDISLPSQIRTFDVLPYCENIGSTPDANLSVISPADIAGNYQFSAPAWGADYQQGTAYGQLVLANDGSANPTLGCGAFINAAAMAGNIAVIDRGNCEFGNKAVNAQNAGAIAAIIVNNVAGVIDMGAGAQSGNVTIPTIMVSQADGNLIKQRINQGLAPMALLGQRDEWIQEVTIGQFGHTSGNDGGYAFHRASGDIDLFIGQSYPAGVLASALGGAALPQRARIWIDVDQDGSFSPSELLLDETGSTAAPITGNIDIPANAIVGSTRMRVQSTGAQSASVCGGFVAGETEDYCVTLAQLPVGMTTADFRNLRLHPNPTNGIVTLSGTHASDIITAISMDGKLMTELRSTSALQTLDVSGWAPGVYVLTVRSETGLWHQRLVVSR